MQSALCRYVYSLARLTTVPLCLCILLAVYIVYIKDEHPNLNI